MSLKKRTIKNSLFSMGAFLWPMLLAFFVTPFVVQKLGQEEFGVLALITSFIGFFAVLDFGVAPSLVKFISEYAAKKDIRRLNRTFSASLLFYAAIGAIGALLIFAGSQLFIDVMLKNSSLDKSLVQTAFSIAAIGFFINMLLAAYGSVPGALQRMDITSSITLVVSTVSSIGTAVLVWLGYGIVALTIYNIATSLLGIVIYFLIDKKLLPQLKLTRHVSSEDFKRIFSFSGYATVATLSGMVISQFDRLLLGAQLGPSAVTYYVIPGNLTIKILGLVVAASTIMFPLTSALLANKDLGKLRHVYQRATRIVLLLLVFIVVPAIFLANKFLLYWLGPDFSQNSTIVFQLLLVTYGVNSLHAIPYLSAYGAGKPKYNAIYSLVVAVLNVLLMFIFIPIWGINGAALAYLLAVLPTLLFIIFVEKKILEIDTRVFWRRQVMVSIAQITILALVSYIVSRFISSLMGVVFGYAAIAAFSGIMFVLLRLVSQEDMRLLYGFMNRMKSRPQR